MKTLFVALLGSTALLAACNNAQDRAEDQIEAKAEANAIAAGPAIAALGLTEMQLLDADIVDASGKDLGDVEGVLRDANGQVDRLLVKVDDTNPSRMVHVPVAGLATVQDGDDTDLRTSMTKAQLTALPDVTPVVP